MHAKSWGRLAGCLVLAAGVAFANTDPSTNRAAAEAADPVVEYTNDDARMNAAQKEARAHLDRFMAEVLDGDGVSVEGAAIKVAVAVDGTSNFEVIWVAPFASRDGGLIGLLANQPRDIAGNAGDPIRFSRDQVRDWSFFGPDGKMYGSFTTRVILADLEPAEAAQIAALLSDAPTPDHWR